MWCIDDDDFERSLTENEMKHVHNLWMNDVKEWMSDDCYQLYTDLLKSAADLKSQGRDECKSKKGHCNGPGQQAQQLKKQRFNKVLSDLGAKKKLSWLLCGILPFGRPKVFVTSSLCYMMSDITKPS